MKIGKIEVIMGVTLGLNMGVTISVNMGVTMSETIGVNMVLHTGIIQRKKYCILINFYKKRNFQICPVYTLTWGVMFW
jgi:hypothetical protein